MTAEEHIAFQLCAALDIEPTQRQWGDLVGVLVRYKHGQKIATSHLERELMAARSEQQRLRDGLRLIAIGNPASLDKAKEIASETLVQPDN